MIEVTVREYARLTTAPLAQESLDEASITPSAFEYLCQLAAQFRQGGASLLLTLDALSLRLDNHVGVIETPCGTRIEVLPKHVDRPDDKVGSRKLLRRMLQSALDIPARDAKVASVDLFDTPLTEWVISRFLAALDRLVKRGIRMDYVQVEEELRFLRGQLDIPRQVRTPAGRQHYFQVRHDIFSADRAENRLLKSALNIVRARTRDAANWRLAGELSSILDDVRASSRISDDLKRWSADRLMFNYQAIKPWCELILGEHMPLAFVGGTRGISFLFPMQRLFEQHVAKILKTQLTPGASLITQSGAEHLCKHLGSGFFLLRPDLVIASGERHWILDTKWKRITNETPNGKSYDLNQADVYQMFAYGHKFMSGAGTLVLIYPRSTTFQDALPVFHYSEAMRLFVVPFDLETDAFEVRTLHGDSFWDLPLETRAVPWFLSPNRREGVGGHKCL